MKAIRAWALWKPYARRVMTLTRVSPFLIQRTIESATALLEFGATAARAGFVAADLGRREDRLRRIECAVEVTDVLGFIGFDTDDEVDPFALAEVGELGKSLLRLDT
jgi:hypothetical protein